MYCSSWRGITHKWAARYLLPVLTIVILTQCHSAPAVLSSLLLVGAGWLTFAASARLHTTIWHKVECEQQAAKLDVGVISFLIAWGGAPTVIVLIGGAYGGPAGRQPWGDAGKAMRFVTHMQTPRPAVTKLLKALKRLL